jgi:hypothetical protein
MTDVIMRRWAKASPKGPSPSGTRRSAIGSRGRAALRISTDKVDTEIPHPCQAY